MTTTLTPVVKDYSYTCWLKQVDDALVEIYGGGIAELPNKLVSFKSMYEQEMNPDAAANETLRKVGLSFDEKDFS